METIQSKALVPIESKEEQKNIEWPRNQLPLASQLPLGLPTTAYEEDPAYSITLIKDNKYCHYSLEEMLNRRLHNFKNWWCAAGKDSVFINADGNVFVGTCRVGGIKGNVYEGPIQYPLNYIRCTKDWCSCGADMRIRKVKNPSDFEKAYQPVEGEKKDEIPDPDMVLPYPYKVNWLFPLSISWDLGRRCNYSCSYCHPHISNTFENYRSWGSLLFAVKNLMTLFSEERLIKWNFTGGEPTLVPAYMNLVKYLRYMGHEIHTQTNGSRQAEYYSELIEYSCIGVSVHFEFLREEAFLKVCEAVIAKKKSHFDAVLNWFGIRLMVPPGGFQRARVLKDKIQNIPYFLKYGQVYMSTLYEREKASQMMSYDAQELSDIIAHS